MPQSLNLSTPPQASNKRQRSRDSRKDLSRPGSAGQTGSHPQLNDSERLARSGIRVPAYLNKTKSEITASFQDLEWKQRYRLAAAFQNPNSPFRVDRSNAVVLRNRYTNVQPWDAARVRLKTPIGGSDYVNASPISLRSLTPSLRRRGRRKTSQELSGSDALPIQIEETRYIATQGPKEGQFSHFWHMALQESVGDVGVIVMLTQCYEGLKEKCAEYFPMDMEAPYLEIFPEPKNEEGSPVDSDGDPFLDLESDSADANSDGTGPNSDLSQTLDNPNDGITDTAKPPRSREMTEPGAVKLLSVRHDSSLGSEIRELEVTIGGTSKKFYHYFYGKWADYGRVEPEDRVALLELTRKTRQIAGMSPRIVHCSAGVGRTGTWIALDFLLRELEEGRLLDQVYAENSHTSPAQSPPSNHSAGSGISKRDTSQSKEQARDTWGKSGPPKITTPEPKEQDLIHDTVDLLRQQRMMMVMNEIQYGSLYEVLREQFINKYAEKEVGVTVTPAAVSEEPSPKVRRMSTHSGLTAGVGELGMGVHEASQVGLVKSETVSEAETEIEGEGEDVKMGMVATPTGVEDDNDPYEAVSPDRIMKEIDFEGRGRGKERENEAQGGNEGDGN